MVHLVQYSITHHGHQMPFEILQAEYKGQSVPQYAFPSYFRVKLPGETDNLMEDFPGGSGREEGRSVIEL